MVGEDAIVAAGAGLVEQGEGGVERHQDAADVLPRVADQEADVVPVLRQASRHVPLQDVEKVADSRHGQVTGKSKRGTPLVDVPLSGH